MWEAVRGVLEHGMGRQVGEETKGAGGDREPVELTGDKITQWLVIHIRNWASWWGWWEMGFAFWKADWFQGGQHTQEEQGMGRKDSSKAEAFIWARWWWPALGEQRKGWRVTNRCEKYFRGWFVRLRDWSVKREGERRYPGCWHHCGTVGPFTAQRAQKRNI